MDRRYDIMDLWGVLMRNSPFAFCSEKDFTVLIESSKKGNNIYSKKRKESFMIEQDTIKLLRECDAGVKMGVASIDDVIDHVRSEDMKHSLNKCRDEHEELKAQIQGLLERYHDDGKSPNAFAKGMSWMKTNMKLAMNEKDSTIADLITDGCNMGVKSLSRYLNQYAAAEEKAKDITKKIISQEEQLSVAMRDYL